MAEPKIRLYRALASRAISVLWCLEELGLDYEIVNVPTSHADRTALRDVFGVTGVPSLTDGDVKIADDDDAIIAYLEKTYGPKRNESK